MELSKSQIKKANKLLKLLCKLKHLVGNEVYPLFDSITDAVYICSALEEKLFLIVEWKEGKKIAILTSNENTCNAVTNNLLDKEFKKGKKSMFSANLNLIFLIVSVILNIVLIGSHFQKSDDPSKLNE